MSERPRSEALTAYQAKCHDAERRLARTFAAFVRTPHHPKHSGYVVCATVADMGVWQNGNFTFFFTTPPGSQLKEVSSILDSVQQETRRIYSDKMVHATVAANTLAPYSRLVLEDWHEPMALSVCGVFLDCVSMVTTVDYRGSTDRQPSDTGSKRIFLVGCYDKRVNSEVRAALRKRLLDSRPTPTGLKRLARDIRRITKLRRVVCIPIPR